MKTPIQTALGQYEDQIGGKFKPDKRFYERVGINSKRFAQLVRGDKVPLLDEAARLSEFFNVPLQALCTK
ncbi:MAG: hypothetical protein KKG00_04545 [Bacteroidetes bacterium]|nr:hypothetical protein [Bacteroidota bacterium]